MITYKILPVVFLEIPVKNYIVGMPYLLRQYFYVTQLCGVTWIDQKCLQANQNKQTIPIIWRGTG